MRASRLRHWEKADGPPSSVNLNYDLKSTGFAGDLSFLRSYPIQFAGGIAYRRFEARNPGVLFPLGVDDDFFGFNSRLWGYVGRFTPSAGVRRDFIAIKTIDAVSGLPVLIPGGGTNADLGLRWDGSGRLSASSTFSKTFFTDDNERTSAGGLVAYRLRGGIPRLTVDYGLTWGGFFEAVPELLHAASERPSRGGAGDVRLLRAGLHRLRRALRALLHAIGQLQQYRLECLVRERRRDASERDPSRGRGLLLGGQPLVPHLGPHALGLSALVRGLA